MNPRTLASLCASFLLWVGCDVHLHESKKKPEAPAATEPSAAPPQTTAAPEAMQTTAPEPERVADAPAEPIREPLRVGGLVTRPEVIHRVPIDFAAFQNGEARMTGVFIAEAVIDEKGDVTNARILKSSGPKIDAAALAAILKWKFKPATLNGKPVAVYYTLTVNIDLQ
ncbi:MAG TPA: TonB family protein [Thermoanaerobaculia bacterium]|nr:TonB family protein [Thermoanaerobaculia bacterium]